LNIVSDDLLVGWSVCGSYGCWDWLLPENEYYI